MRIEPSGGPQLGRTPRSSTGPADNRYRLLSTTLSMAIRATSNSSNSNLGSLETLARSLSSAARDLSRAAGFARQGQDATRQTDETLRAIRAVAEEASRGPLDAKEHEKFERKLQGLRDTVSRLQATSFEGLSVFSENALSVQVRSADISTADLVPLETSASARATLQEFSSSPEYDLASIDQTLTATETLSREFESAARRIEDSRSIVAQERVANIAEARGSGEQRSAQELGERATAALRANAAAISKAHSLPGASALLMLLEEPT